MSLDLRPRMLPHEDAARYVGISGKSLQRLVNQRRITAYQISPNKRGYRLEDLDALVDARPEWEATR